MYSACEGVPESFRLSGSGEPMLRMLSHPRPTAPEFHPRHAGSPGRWLLTAILCASGSGLAVSNEIAWLDLDPAKQVGYVNLNTNLGFPIGEKELTLAVDCQGAGAVRTYVQPAGGPPIYLADWKADARFPPALTKAGFLAQKAGTFILKDTVKHQQLSLTCAGGVLSTNFSQIETIGGFGQVGGPFYRDAEEPSVNMTYGLNTLAKTKLVNFSVQVRVKRVPQGYMFTRLEVDASAPESAPKAQVFMSDGRYLYPIYFNGQAQDNAQVSKVVLKQRVDLYVSEDPAKGGWRRTTYDYGSQVLKTVPVPKPSLPIRQ
jgi:hypothetical protein